MILFPFTTPSSVARSTLPDGTTTALLTCAGSVQYTVTHSQHLARSWVTSCTGSTGHQWVKLDPSSRLVKSSKKKWWNFPKANWEKYNKALEQSIEMM